jgi:hypothetical protein
LAFVLVLPWNYCSTEIDFFIEKSVLCESEGMRPIKLEELIPKPAEFTLRATGRTYTLRPFSLEDRVWVNQTFGDQVEAIFREVRMKEIARIVFHQFDDKTKKEFRAQDVQIVDEDGEEHTERLGGVDLLCKIIQGYDEQIAIYSALMQTFGISQPLMEEMAAEVDSEKTQKKRDEELKTGEKSSTSLPASTVGLSDKSES